MKGQTGRMLVCIFVLMNLFLIQQSFGKSMDQMIQEAAKTSHAMDFVQDSHTRLVEYDILYTKQQWDAMQEEMMGRTKRRKKRNAIKTGRWTNNQIPYVMSNVFSSRDRSVIQSAMNDYHRYTCLRFRRATSRDRARIVIQNGGGCSSYVGMTGNSQPVTLASGCRHKGIVIHEFGHAAGFHHEQTRPDRDEYVTIYRNNVSPSMYYNFQKNTWRTIKQYNVPYDYLSVMHYGETAFTMNGGRTIVAKDRRYQKLMGNRPGFSFRDVKLLTLMYNCNSHCQKRSCPGEGFQGKDCKCWCPGSGNAVYKECGTGTVITGGGRTTVAPVTTRRPVITGCQDLNSNCPSWSSLGYCTRGRYVTYMRTNCKKTCRICGTTTTNNCRDASTSCQYWARIGECSRNSRYMLRYCRRSCRRC